MPFIGNYFAKETNHFEILLGASLIMVGMMIIYWTMMVGNVGVVVTCVSLMGVVAISIDYFFYGRLASVTKLIGCGIIIIGIMITFLMEPLINKCKTPKSIEEPLIKT